MCISHAWLEAWSLPAQATTTHALPDVRRYWAKTSSPYHRSGQRWHTRCTLLAQSGHSWLYRTCPLSGVERTCRCALHMSAYDPKRTSGVGHAPLAVVWAVTPRVSLWRANVRGPFFLLWSPPLRFQKRQGNFPADRFDKRGRSPISMA